MVKSEVIQVTITLDDKTVTAETMVTYYTTMSPAAIKDEKERAAKREVERMVKFSWVEKQ